MARKPSEKPETPDSLPDYSLASGQAHFITALRKGPAAFPDGLFTGSVERAFLGMKVHANTVSHAQLVTLEELFPKTLEHLGKERFNTLTRAYILTEDAMAVPLRLIGRGFSSYCASTGLDLASCDLLRIEWARRESYHAAEGDALTREAIAALDEAALLDMVVAPHPAARLVLLDAAPSDAVAQLCGLEQGEPWIAAVLVTRPEAKQYVRALSQPQAIIFEALQKLLPMSNHLQQASELVGDDAVAVLFGLIDAGALIVKAD